MKKQLYVFLIVLLLFQTFSSVIALPKQTIAQSPEQDIFKKMELLIEAGNSNERGPGTQFTNLKVEWSVDGINIETDKPYTHALPPGVEIEKKQRGELREGDVGIGTYAADVNNTVTINFNEEIHSTPQASGTFTLQTVNHEEKVPAREDKDQQQFEESTTKTKSQAKTEDETNAKQEHQEKTVKKDSSSQDSSNSKTASLNSEKWVKSEESTKKNEKETGTLTSKNTIVPFAGNLNVDIDISPHSKTVISGKAAGYNLVLKVTGSKTEYTNAKIVVDLPITDYTKFTQDVSELVIASVTPVYDEDNHTLTYEFDSLKSGRTYETSIKVNTINGISPDGSELIGKATFEANAQTPISDQAVVSINASGAISLSKKFVGVQGGDRNLPYPNSTTLWEIKMDIPKNDIGQSYIKEGSQIIVTDTLPSGLTYESMASGPKPTQSGNTLTWTFEAPSIEEQEKEDGLFSTTVRVLLKVAPGTVDTTQENNVDANVTFINDDDLTTNVSASDQVTIVDSDTATGDQIGRWYVPVHIGPADGKGNLGNSTTKNPNPVVYDDALLGFRHGIAPLPESKEGDFQQYTTSYEIDPNLIFKELKTPRGFIYRPNGQDYPPGIPLDNMPVFDLKAKVNGIERLLVKNAKTDHIYTRDELGLDKTDQVNVIYYDFTYAPSGMLNVGNPHYYFEVTPGFIGTVTNKFNVYGVDGSGKSFNHKYDEGGLNTSPGPRTAQIDAKPTDQPPIATVKVELLDHESGEVIPGKNRIKVVLNNTNSSTLTMQEPLETVVLMPAGVTLDDNPNADYIDGDGRSSLSSPSALGGQYEVLSHDYNGSGRQLIKIEWNDDRLRIGQNIVAELDVTISEIAPNTLQFDVYGFSGDEELQVPDSSGESITDTILQIDDDDLNGDGITDQPRLKSGNIYTIRGKYDIQTEKLIKGELDDEFTYFGHTIPSGSIDYRLKLTNTTGVDITNMTLIDVLPSVGDLGITDNIERASQFTPKMTNSIDLPPEWEDKVDVFYSTAKNPKRDDLTKNTIYPDSTTQLTNPGGAEEPNWMTESEVTDWSSIHSFKIELKDETEWIKGQDIIIQFSLQAPSELEVDRDVLDASIDPTSRAAWNSFAVATDHGQAVEPLRVGVYMDYDIEDPNVEKTVNDQKEPVELTDQDEPFTWKVDYDFGNYTGNWGSVVLSDQIHELLDIEDVQVVDQDGQDVTGNGHLDITDNLVSFTLEKQNGSFAYLKNQIYTLIIDSKIKDTATEEELEPFIQSGGIPNTAELIIDDDPLESNEVKVKPPVYGDIHIIKVDKETNEVLRGAEFELRKCENENSDLKDCDVIASGTTDEDGKVDFENIKKGTYQLIETKAPEGYRLITKPIEIEITDQDRVIELEVENEKTGWELPDTGGIGTLIFYFLGALLMASALSLLILFKKKKSS